MDENENILPNDMEEVLSQTVQPQKTVSFNKIITESQPTKVINWQPSPPPQSNWSPPPQFSQSPSVPTPAQNNIKKKNVFVKISNNISKKPKCYLILIILLIVIILILIVYYRGFLFIGPYCPNNVKSKNYSKFKNNDKFKNNGKKDDDKLINSLKL